MLHNASMEKNQLSYSFEGMLPGEIELAIEDIKDKIHFLQGMFETVEGINYLDKDRHELFIKYQDDIRAEKTRLRNAENALAKSNQFKPNAI